MATITKYVWDSVNDCVLSELDGSNVTTAVYTNEAQPFGGVLSQRRGSASHYHHHDALGSTRFLTDSSGTITDTYLYDAWGNAVASTGSTVNPFKWVGKYGYQSDSSTGQVYVRARMYQPAIARWTSADPVHPLDGMNGFAMAQSSTTRFHDPGGLFCVPYLINTSGPVVGIFGEGGSRGVFMEFTTEIHFLRPCCDCAFRQYVRCEYETEFLFPDGTVITGRRHTNQRHTKGVFVEDCGDLNRDGRFDRWECYGAHRPSVLKPGTVYPVDEWKGCNYSMRDRPADGYQAIGSDELLEEAAEQENKKLPNPLPRGIKVRFCMACAFRQTVRDTETGDIVWTREIDENSHIPGTGPRAPAPQGTPLKVCRTDDYVPRRRI